jgi:hypothetical protein
MRPGILIDPTGEHGRVTRAWRPGGLPSGVYYMSAQLGDLRQVRKVVWLGDRR